MGKLSITGDGIGDDSLKMVFDNKSLKIEYN